MLVLWKEIRKFHTRAWLCHHGSNRVPPYGVMSGLFMRLCSRIVPVNFDENKVARIVQLLNDVKSRDSCFANARLRVLDSCLLERLNEFRLYVDMHMNN